MASGKTAEISLGIDAKDAKSKMASVGSGLKGLGGMGGKAGMALGKGLAGAVGSAVTAVAAVGKQIYESLGIDRFVDDMKAKVSELANITDQIYGRVDKVKGYRESLRDLNGQMERNNEIAKINPGLAMEMTERNRDLQIQIDNLNWSNRNLTEEDIKREEELAKLGARWDALKENVTDYAMSLLDVVTPAIEWVISVFEKGMVPVLAGLSTAWTTCWDAIDVAAILEAGRNRNSPLETSTNNSSKERSDFGR